ncbi:Out at first protein [Armadillidium nasatum]|uniref:Out at first protein n=1 Tax=Armadillidium nasatum TaxID=96803 RepID=A0A5N5T196_9CRUS|nr:Out at first protein [Armadillidium nasatum]
MFAESIIKINSDDHYTVKVANHMAHDACPSKVLTNRSQNYCLFNSHLWIASLSLSADCECESSVVKFLRNHFLPMLLTILSLLEFSLQDGSHTAQIVDFKQELQIFRVIMLGEEELDQSPYQVFCFVTKFAKGDFISSDAMSKLRQKNPTTVRTPEGDHGTEEFTMDLSLDVEGSSFISSHIPSLCAAASSSTYASEKDLKLWVTQKQDVDWDWSTVREATRRLPAKGLSFCSENSKDSSCICNHQICISWYPCGLKYCTGKDNSGKTVSYRCGIRTCRKCYKFNFYVTQKQACLTALE